MSRSKQNTLSVASSAPSVYSQASATSSEELRHTNDVNKPSSRGGSTQRTPPPRPVVASPPSSGRVVDASAPSKRTHAPPTPSRLNTVCTAPIKPSPPPSPTPTAPKRSAFATPAAASTPRAVPLPDRTVVASKPAPATKKPSQGTPDASIKVTADRAAATAQRESTASSRDIVIIAPSARASTLSATVPTPSRATAPTATNRDSPAPSAPITTSKPAPATASTKNQVKPDPATSSATQPIPPTPKPANTPKASSTAPAATPKAKQPDVAPLSVSRAKPVPPPSSTSSRASTVASASSSTTSLSSTLSSSSSGISLIPSTCEKLEAAVLKPPPTPPKPPKHRAVPVPAAVAPSTPDRAQRDGVVTMFRELPASHGLPKQFKFLEISGDLSKSYSQFLERRAACYNPFLDRAQMMGQWSLMVETLNTFHLNHCICIRATIRHMLEHPHIALSDEDRHVLYCTLMVFTEVDRFFQAKLSNLFIAHDFSELDGLTFPLTQLLESSQQVVTAFYQVRDRQPGAIEGAPLICQACEDAEKLRFNRGSREVAYTSLLHDVPLQSHVMEKNKPSVPPPSALKKTHKPGGSTASQDTLVEPSSVTPPPSATPTTTGPLGRASSVRSSTTTVTTPVAQPQLPVPRPSRPGDNPLPDAPDIRASHYAYDDDGKLISGTLEVMVYALLAHNGIEDEHIKSTILRTFRYFTTPDTFLEELVKQYNKASAALYVPTTPGVPFAPTLSPEEKQQNIQIVMNVAKVLKEWVCKYWDTQKDLYILNSIRHFAEEKRNELHVGVKFCDIKKDVELLILSYQLTEEGASKAGTAASVAKAKDAQASGAIAAAAAASSAPSVGPTVKFDIPPQPSDGTLQSKKLKKGPPVSRSSVGMSLKNISAPVLHLGTGSAKALAAAGSTAAATTTTTSLGYIPPLSSAPTNRACFTIPAPPVPPKDNAMLSTPSRPMPSLAGIPKPRFPGRPRALSSSGNNNNNNVNNALSSGSGGGVTSILSTKFTYPLYVDCDFVSYLLAFDDSPAAGPRTLAQQLTMELVDRFKALDPKRAIEYWRMPKSRERDAQFEVVQKKLPGSAGDPKSALGEIRVNPMKALVEYDNAFTTWVVFTVVKPRDVVARRRMIRLWLNVANACLDVGNLSTPCAIHFALTNSRVSRMKRTVLGVHPRLKAIHHKLACLFAKPTGGRYLQALRASPAVIPVIPFLISSLVQSKERETMDKRPPADKDPKNLDPKERAKYHKSTTCGETIIHLKDFEKLSEAIELLETIPKRYAFQKDDGFSKFVKGAVKPWVPSEERSEDVLWEIISKRSIKHEPTDPRFSEFSQDDVWVTQIVSGSVDAPPPNPSSSVGTGTKVNNVADTNARLGFTARRMQLDGLHLAEGEQALKVAASLSSILDFMCKVVPAAKSVGVGGSKS